MNTTIPTWPSVTILGVRVHRLSWEDALRGVETLLADGRQHQIGTVNPEFVMQAQRDHAFRALLNGLDMAWPDGIGLLWAAKWLRCPIPARVTGSDGVPRLAELAARRGWKLFLLGAAPGVAAAAAARLQERLPRLQIVGTYAGSPDVAEEEAIIRLVNEARPDILFVAYGAPAQDYWIQRNLTRLNSVRLAMGVGGSLDFIVGKQRRAPVWMRRVGLEWLYRLLREPWRWRRQLALPRFAFAVLRQRRRGETDCREAGKEALYER